MNNKNSIFKLSLFLVFFVASWPLFSQSYAERALYRDSFAANKVNDLEIINKYGNIHVQVWDVDSVKISTDVYLSSTSEKKLQTLKNGIKIRYSEHDNLVIAQTIFGESQSYFLKELQNITRSLAPGVERRIEINYEIFIPKHVNLKIHNYYGDISMENFDARLKVDQKNGSFKAVNLNGESNLKFSFVNAMVNDMKECVLDMHYSNLNLNKAVNMNCQSKLSEIYADAIGVLKLKSSRDKINIGALGYAYGSASYTNLRVLELKKEIDGYFTYGQVNIDKMHPDISLIDIDSERTDIKLFVPKNVGYNYDILYNEDADVLLPTKGQKEIDNLDMEGMKAVKGTSGIDPNLEIRIRALKRCLVHIMHMSVN